MKYFFVSFKSFNEKGEVGSGCLVVVCSCCLERIYDAIIDYYNERASFENKANQVTLTALTVIDKQTAAQLSNDFTDGSLIIDDGEKEEEKEEVLHACITRDKDGTLCLHIGPEPPKKYKTVWDDYFDNFIELDGSLFPEVQWSDEEPTKVKLVIK